MYTKTARVWYTHDWIKSTEQLHQILGLSQNIKLVFDENKPDYLFVGEQIYSYYGCLKRFLALKKFSPVTIFFSMEAISPDFNIFDYAITNDLNLNYGDRAMRIRYLPEGKDFKDFDQLHLQSARDLLNAKTEFCNFIYSNYNAHPNRDMMFHKMNKYKNVHSLGRHLRNYESPAAAIPHYMEGSIEMKKPYKFSIAFENATSLGYTTEKLLTSFQANTVPIYWGNTAVSLEYNTKAFINCHDYDSFDAVLEMIKRVDNNDDLWCQMMSEPKRTPQQIEESIESKKNLTQFLDNILLADKTSAKRAPEGTWPIYYLDWFQHQLSCAKNRPVRHFLKRVKQKIKSLMKKITS